MTLSIFSQRLNSPFTIVDRILIMTTETPEYKINSLMTLSGFE